MTRFHVNMNTNNQTTVDKGLKFTTNDNTVRLITVANSNNGTSPFTVLGSGKTQIGGEFGGSSTYMLAVNGKIGARELKVTLQNPWPDYVFSKNYPLPNLEMIEKYVEQHKHLPNIPSGEDLLKETCGLDVADMQGRQMEKIEEIYLYLFELKKEIEKLKEENKKLQQKIK